VNLSGYRVLNGGDNQPKYGESLQLFARFKNYGLTAAQGVKQAWEAPSPYVDSVQAGRYRLLRSAPVRKKKQSSFPANA